MAADATMALEFQGQMAPMVVVDSATALESTIRSNPNF